jgi:integrase
MRTKRPTRVKGLHVMALKISDTWLKKQAAPSSGAVTCWDSEITGFGARIFAPTKRHTAGARSFFVNYRIDGREKRFTIGSYPDWSAEAARAEAKELRRRIDRGEDPALDRKTRREAPTVRDLAERYRVEHLANKAKSSQINDWAMIKNDILPAIGDRKVADIHDGDIGALRNAITARGAAVRANRVLAVASTMFALALRRKEGEDAPWRDQAQGNPCKGVSRNPEEGHERFFSPAELAALGDALQAYGDTPAANCLRFIMLTGCRPGEAMLATWNQFEAEPGFWVKPSAHTKQRKVHRVPLGAAAIELLAEMKAQRESNPRRARSDFVFPGQSHGEPLKQLRSTWEAVAESATIALWRDAKDPKVGALVASLEQGLKRAPTVKEVLGFADKAGAKLPPAPFDARIYDLRHSFASVGAGGGLSLQIIGRLLGHTQMRTTQRYAHLADDPLKEAAARITATIANAGKSGQNVVALKRDGVS